MLRIDSMGARVEAGISGGITMIQARSDKGFD